MIQKLRALFLFFEKTVSVVHLPSKRKNPDKKHKIGLFQSWSLQSVKKKQLKENFTIKRNRKKE